tara:strand:- start:2599 stop:3555 length:957 start_codon:yes stop_codon:yes gene_type:complete
MEDISKRIRDYKPFIKDNSLDTYLRNLRIIYQRVTDRPSEPTDIDFLNGYTKVFRLLQDMKPNTKKNYLNSIIVASQAYKNIQLFDIYNPEFEKSVNEINKQISSQNKSISQNENWESLDNLNNVLSSYKKTLVDKGIFDLSNEDISKTDFKLLQKYVVGMLYIGSPDNPPLRLDYAPMKIISKNVYNDIPTDNQNINYLVITGKNKKEFILNDYKTKGTYGQKKIPVSSIVNKVLNVWLNYNTTDYLLLNSKNESLTSNGLTKLITSVFLPTGKKISVSMLRHIFISETFPADSENRQKIADLMLHNISMQTDYAKK